MEEECPRLKEQHAEGPVADRAWEYDEQQSGEKLRERTRNGAAGYRGLVESFLSPSNNGRPLKDKQGNASRGEVRRGGF